MSMQSTTSTMSTSDAQGSAPLSQAGQEVGESVGHLADRAADLGFTQADRGKEQAAHGINQVAQSIRRVSDEMRGEQPAVADVAQTAADQAERIASYLQQTDAREILHTAEDVARRQPLIFLGGAFILGFAATRLLKASGGDGERTWRGYGSTRYGAATGYAASTGYGSDVGLTTSESYRATGPGGRTNLDELSEEGV